MTEAMDLLIRLDRSLNEAISVIGCGGVVIHLRYGGERSQDVDVMYRLKDTLKVAAANIAKETGDDEHWFNDDAVTFYNFDQTLPDDWQARALSEDLKLHPLARRDLILTKLFGVFSRGGWAFIKKHESRA